MTTMSFFDFVDAFVTVLDPGDTPGRTDAPVPHPAGVCPDGAHCREQQGTRSQYGPGAVQSPIPPGFVWREREQRNQEESGESVIL